MSNASMEQIEECFVKFFLSQAAEIEPQTIQVLIDNGYRNKVSLLCFDLLHDLSQLNEVPLAQRSILRKYIGALQEFCPFNVTIDQNALNRHVDDAYAKPNKKRKIDDADDYYGGYSANPFSGHFSFNRTFGDISPSIGSNSSSLAKSPPNHLMEKYQKIGTTAAATSPVSRGGGGSSSRRTIRKQSNEDANEDGGDHVQDYEMAEQNTTKMNTTARTSRGGRKAREPIPRTKSQIRFHAEKERQNMSLNIKDDEESEPISSPVSEAAIVAPKSRRRTVTSSRANSSPIIATTSPVNERHVPTPAEMAIRAKIEQKKKAKEEAKKTVTTTKRRIRRT